jgi:hypothetical protein
MGVLGSGSATRSAATHNPRKASGESRIVGSRANPRASGRASKLLGRSRPCSIDVERHIQKRDIGTDEALEDPAVGVVGITNQDESQAGGRVVTGSHEAAHLVGGDRGALRVAENGEVISDVRGKRPASRRFSYAARDTCILRRLTCDA